jgi:hypothetical protein
MTKHIQNVIVALFVIACAAFTCSLAGAQDAKGRTVETVKGFTEVCTRVDETTLECTRFVKGKATLVETCEVTKGNGSAGAPSYVVCSSVGQ